MRGSMTVEASYIFPFCFVVIVIVCYLGIFEYNQAVLKMTGYECILHTMEGREESEELLKENLLKRAEQMAKTRVLGIKDLEVSVKMTASKISVSYRCRQTMLEVPLAVTAVYERTYPEVTLRLLSGKMGESHEGTVKEGLK